jgi:hypothetical protein
LTVAPTGPAATVELSPLSPSGVVFRTGAGGGILVGGRRFGDRFTVGIGALQGRAGKLAAPLGRAPDPWHFRAGLTGRTRICAVRSGL